MIRAIWISVVFAWLCSASVFAQAPATPADDLDASEVLATFVYLGHFTDRGLTGQFAKVAIEQHEGDQKETSTPPPAELKDLLSQREIHLSSGRVKIPELAFVFGSNDHDDQSPEAILARFRTYGLLELFYNENSKLLDSPLTERKELMKRFDETAKQYNIAVAPLMVKGLTIQKMIMIAGHLRRMSTELDMEIAKALNPAESARVAKVAAYVLPGAIADAKLISSKYALGSTLIDSQMKVDQNNRGK